ncbi:had superfamily hydrolase [Pyrenophora seminiperda CCB06]|uniref:Had superfamily hydrolase n=1 Tax=Pyrenophora seminiperda CCB06 TaxID=1302712 RepID=A0A3M7LV68_9PLEO|nr:had superfamily hydrolase [Pyrenophora seminiperda CCB06]
MVRACIFDVDGTLINSEDIYTDIYNRILREYGRPEYPWEIKATQQSRGSRGTKRLLDWAQVPLTPAEWAAKEKEYVHLFKDSKILPGVNCLLSTLKTTTSPSILLSLASSAGHHKFALKTSHIQAINDAFDDSALHVFGDDPEMSDSKKKPEPDIFLLALKRLNKAEMTRGERTLHPEECLVFEDSIAGVEAARRAGMRVIWVPHPGLADVCRGRELDVLMGRTEEDGNVPDYGVAVAGDTGSLLVTRNGCLMSEDGMAEMLLSLERFSYQAYGINVVE